MSTKNKFFIAFSSVILLSSCYFTLTEPWPQNLINLIAVIVSTTVIVMTIYLHAMESMNKLNKDLLDELLKIYNELSKLIRK